MLIKVDVSPEVFAQLMKAVRADEKFRASLVFKGEKDAEYFGTRSETSLVAFLKDTKLNLETGKMSITLEVSETFGTSEGYLKVPRTVSNILFDILEIFPLDEDERATIIDQIQNQIGDIWSYSGSPTPNWLSIPLKEIDSLLHRLRSL